MARRSTAGGIFSSASSSINGQKSIELQFSLSGGGAASLRGAARDGRLQLTSLQVRAAGQIIDVVVGADGAGGGGGNYGGGSYGGGGGGDEVIDVDSRVDYV